MVVKVTITYLVGLVRQLVFFAAMAVKKIVLKVSINCQKCKKEVLKAVTKVEGITQVAVDGEKGLLTVVGDVDPVCIVKQIKKISKKMMANIISVGPPKPPDKPAPKPPVVFILPPCCNDCQLVAVAVAPYDGGFCTIL